ncbi:MAG: GNAT family N-acetyltransferase [Stackebrandtia sp.]
MKTPYRRVSGREEIISAVGDALFASHFAGDSSRGLAAEGAAAWDRRWSNRRTVMAHGPAHAAAPLVAALVDELRPDMVTVPEEIYDGLPDRARPPKGSRWVWFYTLAAPPPHEAEARCDWLGSHEHADVAALLDEAYPRALNRFRAGDPDQRWFGVRDESGALAACGRATAADNAGPSLSSIAVHPKARRQGLASAMTSWAVRRLFEAGHSLVGLGSYAEATSVHRIYRRLGFQSACMMTSGRLEPRS